MTPPPGGSGTTRSGATLEDTVIPALTRNGYRYTKQMYLAPGLGGGRQRVDTLITTESDEQINLSVKWQGGSGSADEKVPAEILKMLVLADAHPEIKRSYIVLAGPGWTARLKDFYKKDIVKFIPRAKEVKVLETDEFIHLCIRKAL